MAPLIQLLLLAMPLRGPYLQTATPTSIVVVWQSHAPSDAIVRYGSSPDQLDRMVHLTSTSTNQHEVKIEGLEPSTRYYYSVGSSTGMIAGADAEHYFVTSPPVGARVPFRFWVLGDSGTGTAKQARVRDAMLFEAGRRKPDLFLHVGDIAYGDGTDDQFQRKFFEMYPNVLRNTVVWPSMGNHEAGSSNSLTGKGPYYHGYVLPRAGEAGGLPTGTEAYYAFDHANVHFVVLESHRDELRDEGSAMLAWLEMDLAATDQDWIIVYFHHPPYTKGSHDSDTEIAHVEIRQRALPIMEAAGVDLVLGGHSHIYERSYLAYGAYDTPTTADGFIVDFGDGKPQGDGAYHKLGDGHLDATMFVVAGHGGTNVGQDSDTNHPLMYFTEVRNGSVLIDVDGLALSLENVRIDGRVTDSFSIVKDRALALVKPEPGELLAKGSTAAIAWVGAGTSGQVELAYSQDGEAWIPIATVPDEGHFVWTPEEALGQVRLRVRDPANAALSDEMDGTIEVLSHAPSRLIPFGSTWRFMVESQDGRDWTAPAYPDARWGEGPAKIGVCGCLPWDCGCETFVADALLTPSLYLRKHFELDAVPASLRLRALQETGMVVFVNGVEIFRRHVDEDAFDAVARSESTYAEIVDERLTLPQPNPFVIGENVVAVLMKKGAANPNLSFDLELTALFDGASADPTMEKEGCACSSAGGSSASLLLLMLLWLGKRSAQRAKRA